MKEVIFLGSDHAGFEVKEKIKNFLAKKNIPFQDLGPKTYVKTDDYPDFAFKVTKKVKQKANSKGILICGSGVGMAIAANRIKGIRAVLAKDTKTAKMSREHNNTNILTLPGKGISFPNIQKIISVWLNTKFTKDARHTRRLKKLEK